MNIPVMLFFVFVIAAAVAHFSMMLRLRAAGEPARYYRAFWQYEAYYRRYAVLAPERGWAMWPYYSSWALAGMAALLIPFVSRAVNDGPQKLDLTRGSGFLVWAAVIAALVGLAYASRRWAREDR